MTDKKVSEDTSRCPGCSQINCDLSLCECKCHAKDTSQPAPQRRERFFIDTEFVESGPSHPIVLLSIGIVDGSGREFYAVNDQADLTNASDWVKANVLPHLGNFTMSFDAIRRGVLNFVGDCKPEFWGYYSDYDWVAFCQIFGTMMDLPKGWPMYCRDLKQLCVDRGDPKLPQQDTDEHNALNDAQWNKRAYELLVGKPVAESVAAPQPQPVKSSRIRMGQCSQCGEMPDECVCEPQPLSATEHFKSGCCIGELCSACGRQAAHKVGEEKFPDDLKQWAHNLTAYVCCEHFQLIMGRCEPLSATPASNKGIDWSKSMWCATGHHGNCQGSNRLWWECKCECHTSATPSATPEPGFQHDEDCCCSGDIVEHSKDCKNCECQKATPPDYFPNHSELLEQARDLCAAIERLPAGTHQTNLSIYASTIAHALQQLQREGDYFWPTPVVPQPLLAQISKTQKLSKYRCSCGKELLVDGCVIGVATNRYQPAAPLSATAQPPAKDRVNATLKERAAYLRDSYPNFPPNWDLFEMHRERLPQHEWSNFTADVMAQVDDAEFLKILGSTVAIYAEHYHELISGRVSPTPSKVSNTVSEVITANKERGISPEASVASPSSEVTSLLKVLARANYYMQSDKNFTQEEWADYIDTKKKIMNAIGEGEL